jgi:polysaccharide pyruvyl transferase WcaK-like protein
MNMLLLSGFDFWGCGNLGDDLTFAGFMEYMHRKRPASRVASLCAHDIGAMRIRFPSVDWQPPTGDQSALAGASAWIGLGDSPFQSDLGPWLLNQMVSNMEAARAVGIPCYLVGVGMNNREAFSTSQAHRAAELASSIWLRDANCLEAAQEAGLPAEKVHLGGDLAHLAFKQLDLAGDPRTGVMILHAPASRVSGAALAKAAASQPCIWSWVCQEVRSLEDSETALHQRFGQEAKSRLPLFTFEYGKGTLTEVFSHLSGAGLVLTSRYHGGLAAAWSGARVAIYDRNDKLKGLRSELDITECRALDDETEIRRALTDARAVDKTRLWDCANRAEAMLDALFASVEQRDLN